MQRNPSSTRRFIQLMFVCSLVCNAWFASASVRWTELYANARTIHLLGNHDTTEALKLSLESLGMLHRQPHVSEDPTDAELRVLMKYTDLKFFFSAFVFWEAYAEERWEDAFAYGNMAVDVATSSAEYQLNSASIQTADVLELANTIAYIFNETGQPQHVMWALTRALAYAELSGYREHPPEAFWQMGLILNVLLWESNRSDVGLDRGKIARRAIDLLFCGVPSVLDEPVALTDAFSYSLTGLEEMITSDPAGYRGLLEQYMQRAKEIEHPALNLLLAELCAQLSFILYEHGTVSDSLSAGEKQISYLRSSADSTTSTVPALFYQLINHIIAGNPGSAREQLHLMQQMADDQPMEPADQVAVSGYIALAESWEEFFNKNLDGMRETILPIMKLDLQPGLHDHAWIEALALADLVTLDPENALRYYHRLRELVAEAEQYEASAYDLKRLREIQELAKINIVGTYWFDSPDTTGSLPGFPADVSATSLSHLLLLHELQYMNGHWDNLEKLEAEILQRGVSRLYLQTLYWWYDVNP